MWNFWTPGCPPQEQRKLSLSSTNESLAKIKSDQSQGRKLILTLSCLLTTKVSKSFGFVWHGVLWSWISLSWSGSLFTGGSKTSSTSQVVWCCGKSTVNEWSFGGSNRLGHLINTFYWTGVEINSCSLFLCNLWEGRVLIIFK